MSSSKRGAPSSDPAGTVDITTLSVPQLRALQSRISAELEHLATSHAKLRAAQTRFRDCIRSINDGVTNNKAAAAAGDPSASASVQGRNLLVPLTTSLYVKGKLADSDKVLVDVGTGFFVEKTTAKATEFYTVKVEELGANLRDLEKIVHGKSGNLRVIEDVLRQKLLSGEGETAAAGS